MHARGRQVNRSLFAPALRVLALSVLAMCGCLAHGGEDPEQLGLLLAGQLTLDEYPTVAAAGLTRRFLVPAPGVRAQREGELADDDLMWHRPDEGCLSNDLDDFPYEAYALLNHSQDLVVVNLTVEALSMHMGTLADPMIFVYEGEEFPADRLDCLASNDNGLGGRDAYVQVQLTAGSTCLIMITSFLDDRSEDAFGTYVLGVTRL